MWRYKINFIFFKKLDEYFRNNVVTLIIEKNKLYSKNVNNSFFL